MTLVRTSPSGPNIDVGGGGGDVSSVFGRTGDVIAQDGDYYTGQITNTSAAPGDTLDNAIGAIVNDLNNINSDEVENLSSVSGTTVTQALDALVTAIVTSGRLLGSASRLTAGSQSISCPAGTRRVLVHMVGGGAGGGGAAQTASPSQTNSGGGGGGAGAEQMFLYTAVADIASVSVVCGAAGTGQAVTGGNGVATTVTINGETFTSNPGEGGGQGLVTSAPLGTGGRGGLPGQFNFQTGSNFIMLRSSGNQAGQNGTGPNASTVFWYGGSGGSSSFGGGGRGGSTGNGEAGNGNGSGGGGGSSSAGNARNGGNGTPGGVNLLFFS